uniref:Ig-like domain-containing protein n=1 Tax=Ailuropoda melanoleuca TaxID=9646 RepID=A0A7N5JIW0_AILME
MEPPSAPPRGGHVPWQELLLAGERGDFWEGARMGERMPPNATEGKDVLLRAHSLPGDLLGCNWFRGATVMSSHQILSYVVDTQVATPGPAHSGRETIYPNGSLLFQRIPLIPDVLLGPAGCQGKDLPSPADSAPETSPASTCNKLSCFCLGGKEDAKSDSRCLEGNTGTSQDNVLSLVSTEDLPKPIITWKISDPVENADSVVLTCEPQTQSTSYLWSVNSKSLPASARLELSLDNRTLTIHRVTRNDTGPYECETRNPVSAGRSDPLTLNVLYGPDAPTISPSDSHYRLGASLGLSCHAASNPPAQYSWLINGRPQPSTQELFIPNLTANDSGAYTCVASNSGTRLNKTTVQTITVSGKWIPGASADATPVILVTVALQLGSGSPPFCTSLK